MSYLRRILTFVLAAALIVTTFGCGGPAEISATPTPTPEPTPEPDIMRLDPIDAEYAADFTVSNVFASDMVVQRGEKLRVWGFAEETENGKKVSAEFMGMFAEALIENGEWCVQFGARLEKCKELGNTMKIYTDTKSVEFENVLVGDVYMVIGQSNIGYDMSMHNSEVAKKDKRPSDFFGQEYPLRLFYNSLNQSGKFPKKGSAEVCKEVVVKKNTWFVPKKSNYLKFSAYGLLFGRNMVIENNMEVPIGIIEIDGNGQELSVFLPNEVAEAVGADTPNTKGDVYKSTVTKAYTRWMYNWFMYPFERYAIAGIVWYQGESDHPTELTQVYPERFKALMTYMRGTHNVTNPDFPVYIVEFPGCWKVSVNYLNTGMIRAVMGSIPQTLENSYFCSSSDLFKNKSWSNNIHPPIKYEQSERMSKVVSYVQSGKYTKEEVLGPIAVKLELSEDKMSAVITYDNVGEGLRLAEGATELLGFKVLENGYDPLIASCKAEITAPNQITITSDTYFYGVGYYTVTSAYYDKDVNLCNSSGMPAPAMVIYAE